MKKELVKKILYIMKKASLNSTEIKSLRKNYDTLKNVFINQELVEKIESLETIVDSYDIILAFFMVFRIKRTMVINELWR